MKKTITKSKPLKIVEITISNESGSGPFFSITGRLLEIQESGRFTESVSGCIHDEILKVAPELKPFVDIHGSYLTGEPCYAFENGFYWLCGAATLPLQYGPEEENEVCFFNLLKHLRIDRREGNKIMGEVVSKYIDGKEELFFEKITPEARAKREQQGLFRAKNHFKKIVDSMKPRWQNEAAQAIKQLEEMP